MMSSRRSRIKVIANIPQRRKQAEDLKIKESSSENTKTINSENTEVLLGRLNEESNEDTTNVQDSSVVSRSDFRPNQSKIIENGCYQKSLITEEEAVLEKPRSGDPNKDTHPVLPNVIQDNNIQLLQSKVPLLESSQTLNLKYSQNFEGSKRNDLTKHVETDNITKDRRVETIQGFVSEPSDTLPIANDTLPISSDTIGEKGNIFQRPTLAIATHSDTEYSLPPPSPNKANRSRIKAIPRLAHRKTSFSASESEDESRKINRIRNDSVCSTTSVIADSVTECFSPLRPPRENVSTTIPKKICRSEQTRKLAEARREFIRRFGASKPERNRLTMMDLIFYNPDSSPMTNENVNAKEDDPESQKNEDDPNVVENVDDPVANEKDSKSDEENAMPVPQIKIGPSGEIILDEQTLLIENKDIQKRREELQKSKIMDADKFKTGYGIYKKHQRSKSWSHSETLRFYKALNTIGTDFMLMCELFPNRARRELKIKFKKEEKHNRHLIDKALMEPCSFDFDDLQNEIEMEEREMEELKIQKEIEKKMKDEKIKENQQKIIERAQKRKAAELNVTKPKPITSKNETDENKKTVHKTKSVKKPKREKLSIKNFMSDSDADESDLATQSESDDDVVLSRKPTRSGRLPKVINRYDGLSSINYVMKKNKIPEHAQPSNIEPGSIMIITEDGPNGEPVYKIYMVTPEQKATKLDLSSDVIAKAIQLKKGISAESIMTISANVTDDEEMPQENNVTIPADENVVSLKTMNTDNDTEDSDVTITENAAEPIKTNDIVLNNENTYQIYEDCSDLTKETHNSETPSTTDTICEEVIPNIRVIATEEDVCSQDNLLLFNNDSNAESQLVLEVNSDGSCLEINKEPVELRTEENNVTIFEDDSATNLRTKVLDNQLSAPSEL